MPTASVEQIKEKIREYMSHGRSVSLRVLMSMVGEYFRENDLLMTQVAWDKAQAETLILDPHENRVSLKV